RNTKGNYKLKLQMFRKIIQVLQLRRKRTDSTTTQNMLLGATASGLGGCRIGAFSPKLQDLYDFPEHLQLQLIIALGVPAEKVVMESCNGDDIKYWRDDDSIHHVPKRRLEDILLSSTIKL
ncbi:MAG: hypothetical protein QNJ17_10615, partial [Desulfocapsaceae bacterium]|nr:hypothetical protein [Desulfocapsaceae bacterium]